MRKPLVTIGLTVYNAVDTIERAIASALQQSWDNIEIIAVDDGSNDGSYDLLMDLARKLPNLLVYRNNRNSGVATSRNHIIDKARGEFICFFDDDDFSLPARVEDQYNRIMNYERTHAKGNMVLCHTAREVIYPNGDSRIEPTMGQNEGAQAPHGILVAERILYGAHAPGAYGSCATCSQMARTSVYRTLKGFDVELRRGEDTDFSIRLSLANGHFVGLSTPLVRQYMTKTSEKSLADEHKYMCMILIKYRELAGSKSSHKFALAWVGLKYQMLQKRPSFLFGLLKLFLQHPLQTLIRMTRSLPFLGTNLAFSRFHNKD